MERRAQSTRNFSAEARSNPVRNIGKLLDGVSITRAAAAAAVAAAARRGGDGGSSSGSGGVSESFGIIPLSTTVSSPRGLGGFCYERTAPKENGFIRVIGGKISGICSFEPLRGRKPHSSRSDAEAGWDQGIPRTGFFAKLNEF